jgi:hypothetical protein
MRFLTLGTIAMAIAAGASQPLEESAKVATLEAGDVSLAASTCKTGANYCGWYLKDKLGKGVKSWYMGSR